MKLTSTTKLTFRNVLRFIRTLKYRGNARFCPICERNMSQFGKAGLVSRMDAQCHYCGAVERHRLVWLYLNRKTNLFVARTSIKMLHVAPEPVLESKFRHLLKGDYLTADLFNPAAMVKMDITDIQYPENTFDVIYCCHVLEHVVDDKKAMAEFYRVLKPGGWAILLVPIDVESTYEDFSITDPDERLAAFGDKTHVRRYGPDYIDRLRGAGFNVEMTRPSGFLTREDIVRMGITPAAGEIYFCTKL